MKNLKNKKYNSGRKHSVTLVTMIVIFLLGLGFVFSSIAGSAPPKYYGDVDGSGKVEAADARLILRASVNLEKLTGDYAKAADMDKNNKIEAADARLALRTAVNLEKPVLFKTGTAETTTQAQETTTEPPYTLPDPQELIDNSPYPTYAELKAQLEKEYRERTCPYCGKTAPNCPSFVKIDAYTAEQTADKGYAEITYTAYNQIDETKCPKYVKQKHLCDQCGLEVGIGPGYCQRWSEGAECPACHKYIAPNVCHNCPVANGNPWSPDGPEG